MSRHRPSPCTLFTLVALAVAAPAGAQRESQPATPPSADEWMDRCKRDGGWNDNDEVHCEVREYTIAAPSRLRVDAGPNGGVRVRGTDRRDVFIRAQVRTFARSQDEARELAKDLKVITDGGDVRTDHPNWNNMRRRGWSVSYEIWVPRSMNLDLESTNGGVRIVDVRGTLDAETTNGGVDLTDVAGAVRARATNGGIRVQITGDRFEGTGIDAETTNGGVTLTLPTNFNGRLEAETVNGGFNIDFPITLQGRIGKRIATTLGAGGPMVRVATTNGGVTIRKR